jgi:hypothetical protein
VDGHGGAGWLIVSKAKFQFHDEVDPENFWLSGAISFVIHTPADCFSRFVFSGKVFFEA